MKKLINVLFVLAVLAGSLLLSSCGIRETFDTWYKSKGDIPQLPIADESQLLEGENGMLKDAQLYVRFNDVDGLTIRILSETIQTITIGGGAYEIDGIKVSVGTEKTYPTSDFGLAKWTALIKLGSFVEANPPEIQNDIGQFFEGKLNLKRIIVEFLINKLLQE